MAPAPGDKLGFERRQGATLLPFSSYSGSPHKRAFLRSDSLRGEGRRALWSKPCLNTSGAHLLGRGKQNHNLCV